MIKSDSRHRLQSDGLNSLDTLLRILSTQLDTAVVDAGREMDAVMASFIEISEVVDEMNSAQGGASSTVLDSAVSTAICRLQFFDLLSQRIAHVSQALAHLAAGNGADAESGLIYSDTEKKLLDSYSSERETRLHRQISLAVQQDDIDEAR